jgi:hypothetical protein
MADPLLKVFCTDRGTHRRRLLWTGADDGTPALRVRDEGSTWHRDGGIRFRCPSCTRDVQLGQASWDRLVAGLRDAGVSVVDSSYL